MAHFYLNQALIPGDAVVGARLTLDGQEAHHAATVSRMRVGEQILVGNGRGLKVSGPLTSVQSHLVEFIVEQVEHTVRPSPRLHLAQALAKGDRDELAVQAATELGVDTVIPWAANRSIVRWEGQKIAKGRARWQSIVHEAAKQSIRPWLPEVEELASSLRLAKRALNERMLVLEPTANAALSTLPLDDRDLLLVVGPEGGVTAGELELFARAGAEPVRLGPGVLRTSTAGPAAIAVLSTRLGRW